MKAKWSWLFAAALVMACGKDVAAPTAGPAGNYSLTTIGAKPLPWEYSPGMKVYSGAIELKADSSFLDILTYDYSYSGLQGTTTDTLSGRYRISGASIQFVTSSGYQDGGYNGKEISLILGDQPWSYRR